MPYDQHCSNCFAFLASEGTQSGICRARPPQVVVDSAVGVVPMTVWPQVGATDWCGEWEANLEEPQREPIEDAAPLVEEEPAEEYAAPHKKKKKR